MCITSARSSSESNHMARARKKKNSASPQPGKDLYSYRGQLGIPTPERAAHMPDGFAIQQLAVGHDHGGGVIQSRQATILSHPGLLAELYTAVVRQHQDENKPLPAHVDVSMTPGDRVTAQNRAILWEYILARIDAVKAHRAERPAAVSLCPSASSPAVIGTAAASTPGYAASLAWHT
jgi:hypothetical protein